MIPVSEALDALFALVAPLPVEHVPLRHAAGRVLAQPVTATRDQPPFAASSMDGYALRQAELEPDAMFKVIGEAAAGHRFTGAVGAGQAVRIFTGAPVPEGADTVVIQEDVTRRGDLITLGHDVGNDRNIRPAGTDFRVGTQINAPRRLTPADIALMGAMNIALVPVTRKPTVALLATGDELVHPGEAPGPDQIIASNSLGIAAQLDAMGAIPRLLPIARDDIASLKQAFVLAQDADVIVTIGGASVGDHDLIAPVTAELGMDQAFYKVAMRPGKPLMAGCLGDTAMIGLPGNPVSSMVCTAVFLGPVIRRMQGFNAEPAPRLQAALGEALPENGPREHYMRAVFDDGAIRPAGRQDSSLLSVLQASNALLVRPPHDPARAEGELVEFIDF